MGSRAQGALVWAGVVIASLCALVLATYFVFTSTRMAHALEVLVNDDLAPGLITFDSVQLGPALGEIHVMDVVITGMDGNPIVAVEHLEAHLSLSSMLWGDLAPLTVDGVTADGFSVGLIWSADGRFLFTETFKGRAKSLKPPKEKKIPNLALNGIHLRNGTLAVGHANEGGVFHEIEVTGEIAMAPGRFDMNANLDAGGGFIWALSASEDGAGEKERWVLPLDGARVEEFSYKKGGFRAIKVVLESSETLLSLSPDVVLGKPLSVDVGFRLRFPEELVSKLSEQAIVGDLEGTGHFRWNGSAWHLEVEKLTSPNLRLSQGDIVGLVGEARITVEPDRLEASVSVEARSVKGGDVEIREPVIQLAIDGDMTAAARTALIQASERGMIQVWGALGQIGRLRIQLLPSGASAIQTDRWFVRGLRTQRVQLLYGATGTHEFSLELGRPEVKEDGGIRAQAIVIDGAKIFQPGIKGKVGGKLGIFGKVATDDLRLTSSVGKALVKAETQIGLTGVYLEVDVDLTDGDLRSLKPAFADTTWDALGVLKDGVIEGHLLLETKLVKKPVFKLEGASLRVVREGEETIKLISGAGDKDPDAVFGSWEFKRDGGGR